MKMKQLFSLALLLLVSSILSLAGCGQPVYTQPSVVVTHPAYVAPVVVHTGGYGGVTHVYHSAPPVVVHTYSRPSTVIVHHSAPSVVHVHSGSSRRF